MAKIVTLTWVDPVPTTNVDHIEIWRSVSGGALAQLGSDLALGIQTLVDDNGGVGYADGVVVDYEGRIYNNLGGEVENTDYIVTDLQVTIVDVALPAAPTLLADAGGETNPDTEINLTWTKSTAAAGGVYRVYVGGVLQQSFGDVSLGTLTGLTASTAYNNITVRYFVGGLESADSNSINVTTEAAGYTTNSYTSDFSVDADSFAATTGVVVTGNIDSIGGVNDVLSIYADATAGEHKSRRGSGSFPLATACRLRFDYYFPSTNTTANGFLVANQVTVGDYPNTTVVTDTWTSEEIFLTSQAGDGGLSFALKLNATTTFTGANSPTDDVLYIKNITIDY